MKKGSLLARILPSQHIEKGADLDKGYNKFSKGLFILLTVLVLVPMSVISVLSYHNYLQLLEDEEVDQLMVHVDQAAGTLNAFVLELLSVVKFVARDDRYQELLDPRQLEDLFVRLQREYPGFADIEVIDHLGLQRSYVGPYQVAGHNYSDQLWYKEVLRKGVYISEVFTGFRNAPHFVIAVSRNIPGQNKHWVLRVTIDEKTLQTFIDTISTGYADDMFLVDSNCIAQTQPQKYGKIGEKCQILTVEGTTGKKLKQKIANWNSAGRQGSSLIIVQKTLQGHEIIQAVVDLARTPWQLVLVKEQYLHAAAWRSFQLRLVVLFVCCMVIALFVISEIRNAITDHIRESDKKRQLFLAEAEQSNKLASIGRLAAGVAHEINNPLAIINQKAGLVQDFMEMSVDFSHKQAVDEALDGIQDSVARCKTITHRLLGFARQTDLETEEIDINVTLREVVDFLAKEAAYNQIRIDFDLDEKVSKILSDRGPLQQIFLNITNNAIDAIGSEGRISLASRQVDRKTVEVTIADNGPGMSPEVKKQIFEPFFTTKKTGEGTGLGLSIVYGLVKKIGGTIKVTSETGRGTSFVLTLPVSQN